MRLFLLERRKVGWDEHCGFVVRAETPERARLIAEIAAKWDPEKEWLDPSRSTCAEVLPEGDEGVVLDSFNAG